MLTPCADHALTMCCACRGARSTMLHGQLYSRRAPKLKSPRTALTNTRSGWTSSWTETVSGAAGSNPSLAKTRPRGTKQGQHICTPAHLHICTSAHLMPCVVVVIVAVVVRQHICTSAALCAGGDSGGGRTPNCSNEACLLVRDSMRYEVWRLARVEQALFTLSPCPLNSPSTQLHLLGTRGTEPVPP